MSDEEQEYEGPGLPPFDEEEWIAYIWPDEPPDEDPAWMGDTVRDYVPAQDSGLIDGGTSYPPDGSSLPVDGNDLDEPISGAPLTVPINNDNVPYLGLWRVVGPRVAGQVDVARCWTLTAAEPGRYLQNITYPSAECGAPQSNDYGMVLLLGNGTPVFIPVTPRPLAAGTLAPMSMGNVGEHTDTADTVTFDVTAPATGTAGLQWIINNDLNYNDAGDEKLYGYKRTVTYDSFGRLVAVTAETQNTIDAPEACP